MDFNTLMPVATLVLGAGLSFVANWFNERAKWRRENSARWDQLCLAALTEFATSLKVETRICLRIASWLELGPTTEPLEPTVGRSRLEEAEDARAEKFEAVRLLADAATIAAAQEWQHRVWLLQDYVSDSRQEPKLNCTFNEAYRRAGEARDAFYTAARRTLGVEQHSADYADDIARPEVGERRY